MAKLHQAATARDNDLLISLLDSGEVNINEQDSLGRTAIFIAAKLGNWEIVEKLLDKGANIEAFP